MDIMNLIGRFFVELLIMTKYDYNFSQEAFNTNIIRLTNQVWKLIPMREKQENWLKQLNMVIIEIAGLGEIYLDNPRFLQILAKLEGLQKVETTFEEYRTVIFKVISLLQECKKNG